MNHIEKLIARRIAEGLIAAGKPVSVDYNEGEVELADSTDVDAILKAADAVDECWFLVDPDGDGKFASFVYFIWGNGEEGRTCVSDYTVNLESIVGPISADGYVDAEFERLAAPPTISEDDKVKRVGGAVVQLEGELIAEGKHRMASQLVGAFATLPRASMATLFDILTSPRSA